MIPLIRLQWQTCGLVLIPCIVVNVLFFFFFFFMKSESFFVLEMHMVLILNLSLSHWSKVLGKIAIFSLVVLLGIPSIL